MVSSSRRRSGRVVSSVASRSYSSGSVCYVLSSHDAHQLVQFYSLLLRVHRRVSQQQSSPQQSREYKLRIVKTKGSQILSLRSFRAMPDTGGPLIFLQQFFNFFMFKFFFSYFLKTL